MTIKLRYTPEIKDEKLRLIRQCVGILFLTILILEIVSILLNPISVEGNLECAVDGHADDNSGKLKIHEINNFHCSGSFNGKVPLIVLLLGKD